MTDQEYIDANSSVVKPQALPAGMRPKAVERVIFNITFILGAIVILVIFGTFISAWNNKAVSEAVIAMGSVALGYLGRMVVEDGKTSNN